MSTIDWTAIKQEAVGYFRDLLRIDTTNPPGNEKLAIDYLAGILSKEGIDFQVFEPIKDRANLVLRIKGDGSKRPLLLSSHVDVVHAEPEHWEVPPFSGEIKDGCIWGRGAIDMKHMTVMNLMMVLLAHRNKVKLKRDLIFLAVADEEDGCEWGSLWMVNNHPDLINAEYCLNEGGGFTLHLDKHVFYPIGVAEKGLCWFKVTARGRPGHGSMPHDHQAVHHIADKLKKFKKKGLGFHPHPLVESFVKSIAKTQSFPKNIFLKLLSKKRSHDFIINHLIKDEEKGDSFYAMFHNTASPTKLRAGSKINVIPSFAEAHFDGRILPGQSVESFLAEFRHVMGEDLEIEAFQKWDPTITDYENDFFDSLKKALLKNDPHAIPVPFLIPGFTDSAHYSRLGIKCYGFSPIYLEKGMSYAHMFHGHNERIPVKGFEFGVKVLWDVINETCILD